MRHSVGRKHVSVGAAAIMVGSIGALAVGAFAIGALAIGRLAIRKILVGSAGLESLHIGELTVTRLHEYGSHRKRMAQTSPQSLDWQWRIGLKRRTRPRDERAASLPANCVVSRGRCDIDSVPNADNRVAPIVFFSGAKRHFRSVRSIWME